jgi:hypothetical protein
MIQLRHVPRDWLIYSIGCRPDLAATVKLLCRPAERRGDVVEKRLTLDDWNPKVRRMIGVLRWENSE